MKIDINKISVPNWISTRTYFFNQEKSKSYIQNEKNHTYIELDGLSSDFWYTLINNDHFLEFIKKNKLEEQVDDFLISLMEQGLLILEDKKEQQTNKNVDSKNKNEEDKKYISERDKWLRENGFMGNLFLELTYRCNLKCVHCYNPKNMSNIEIPYDKLKSVIDDAYDLGCLSITISGGESTTYTHFIDLIKYIRNKRISLDVFTNGQLLADDEILLKDLIEVYPHRVCLSLYSLNKNEHEKVTSVKSSYEKTMLAIKKLKENNVDIQIKDFLLNINCDGCLDVLNFAKKNDFDMVADLSLIPKIDGNTNNFKYIVSDEMLFELYKNPQSPFYIGEKPYMFSYEKNKTDYLCFGGFNGLTISPNLDVNICVSYPVALGNLNNISLKDIWLGATKKDKNNKLYQWRKLTVEDLKECYKHDYCRFCHYCAGMGYLENGFLKKSNVLCKQAKAKQKAYEYICKNH